MSLRGRAAGHETPFFFSFWDFGNLWGTPNTFIFFWPLPRASAVAFSSIPIVLGFCFSFAALKLLGISFSHHEPSGFVVMPTSRSL
jgi:hypothetical protein